MAPLTLGTLKYAYGQKGLLSFYASALFPISAMRFIHGLIVPCIDLSNSIV